jgi:hypothetical protein
MIRHSIRKKKGIPVHHLIEELPRISQQPSRHIGVCYLQTPAAQSLASHPRHGQPESGRAPTPAPLSCARLEDKQQGELIGLYTSLENVTVKAERFLHEVIVTVLADKVVAHDSVRLGSFVEQVAAW